MTESENDVVNFQNYINSLNPYRYNEVINNLMTGLFGPEYTMVIALSPKLKEPEHRFNYLKEIAKDYLNGKYKVDKWIIKRLTYTIRIIKNKTGKGDTLGDSDYFKFFCKNSADVFKINVCDFYKPEGWELMFRGREDCQIQSDS
jgi:hypothetical protein